MNSFSFVLTAHCKQIWISCHGLHLELLAIPVLESTLNKSGAVLSGLFCLRKTLTLKASWYTTMNSSYSTASINSGFSTLATCSNSIRQPIESDCCNLLTQCVLSAANSTKARSATARGASHEFGKQCLNDSTLTDICSNHHSSSDGFI